MDGIYKLQLTNIAAGGAALARVEGKTVFVEGGAPDEIACCRITEEHKTWAKAELLEIIEASPVRIDSACAFYTQCGGCNLQHIEYNAQLAAKRAVLTECFSKIGGLRPVEPEIFPSPPWEYRNRMQFHCLRENEPLARSQGAERLKFGLKARFGDIIAVSDCPIADPGIREILQRGGKELRLPPEKDRFTVYSRDGLLLNEGGQERGKTRLLEKDVLLDAGVFFQSNGVMLEKLISVLLEIAGTADAGLPMADLYAGVGTFAVFLGAVFPKIDLVEENKKAVGIARENLRGSSVEFFALRDSDWVKEAKRRKQKHGFMVVDPPRAGLASRLASWLAEDGPPLLAYVSCDPASLARDSKILTEPKVRKSGYKLTNIKLFDFYPQTSHIESLAVFER